MIALERRGVVYYVLFSIALLLGLGVFGYLTIVGLPESKVAAERFLMVSVVLALLAVAGGYLLYRRGQDLNKSLRIAEQRLRQGGFSTAEFFEQRRLGSLGRELQAIYSSMEEISEKKSLRIGALNALNSFLLSRAAERLVVINVNGLIFQASNAFLDALEAKRGEVIGQDVTKLLPELDLEKCVSHFYREKSALELGTGEDAMRVYPVIDARRELAYAVILFGEEKETALPKIPEPIKTTMKNTSNGWFGKAKERWRERRSRR